MQNLIVIVNVGKNRNFIEYFIIHYVLHYAFGICINLCEFILLRIAFMNIAMLGDKLLLSLSLRDIFVIIYHTLK